MIYHSWVNLSANYWPISQDQKYSLCTTQRSTVKKQVDSVIGSNKGVLTKTLIFFKWGPEEVCMLRERGVADHKVSEKGERWEICVLSRGSGFFRGWLTPPLHTEATIYTFFKTKFFFDQAVDLFFRTYKNQYPYTSTAKEQKCWWPAPVGKGGVANVFKVKLEVPGSISLVMGENVWGVGLGELVVPKCCSF